MANYFIPTSMNSTGLHVGIGDTETKIEVVKLEDDDEEDEGEADFEYYSGYDNAEEFDHPNIDPLQEMEDQTEFNGHVSMVTSLLPGTENGTLGRCIHPFTLPIQRLNPPPPKKTGRKKKGDGGVLEQQQEQQPEPVKFTMEDLESTVRTYIDNSLFSRKDPKGRHTFYVTIHKVLNEAIHQNLILPEHVDSYWEKFDDWAASAVSYRLGDHYMLQYQEKANDPDEEAPRPTATPHKKGAGRRRVGIASQQKRLFRLMMNNLENTVKAYVLNSKFLTLRDDLCSRVQFYQFCHKYYRPGAELCLDFYWNALINRKMEYYDGYIPTIRRSDHIPLPPSPKKMKFPPPLPEASLHSSKPAAKVKPLSAPAPSTSVSSAPKSLDMDRLVKLVINSCLTAKMDPLASHKFYWTIHRSLETVQSLNLSASQVTALWKKYDSWAYQAHSQGTPYSVEEAPHLYGDVGELPLATSKVTPKRPQELETRYPRGVREYLKKMVHAAMGNPPNPTANKKIRNDLSKRLAFFESYAHFMEPVWTTALIDEYWKLLLDDTSPGRSRSAPDRFIASQSPTKAEAPLKSRFLPRKTDPLTKKGSKVPLKRPHTDIPKKFDMDRMIQLCINECLQANKDPLTCHKFYWTIHRSLETISSLQLSPRDVNILWQKYDKWAEQAHSTGVPFILDYTNHEEFYEDVTELPRPPKVGENGKLRLSISAAKMNEIRKVLEQTVRDTIIAAKPTLNELRGNLKARRTFLESYVTYIPTDNYSSANFDWIDGYWTRLLRETLDDYKLYLQLGEVVGQKMNEEERNLLLSFIKPGRSKNRLKFRSATAGGAGVQPPSQTNTLVPTWCPVGLRAGSSSTPQKVSKGAFVKKEFSMDYLIKKMINSFINPASQFQSVDPRTRHKFYWTIHRCFVETLRRSTLSLQKLTPNEINRRWMQYDDMAKHAFTKQERFDLECDPKTPKGNRYERLSELPWEATPLSKEVTPLNQLYPNCPKSSALKKYLDKKVRRLVTSSTLVGPTHNQIIDDLKTRRGFFEDYLPYVEERSTISSTTEALLDQYWERLLSDTRDTYNKIFPATVSRSNENPFTIILTRNESSEGQVPCIVLD